MAEDPCTRLQAWPDCVAQSNFSGFIAIKGADMSVGPCAAARGNAHCGFDAKDVCSQLQVSAGCVAAVNAGCGFLAAEGGLKGTAVRRSAMRRAGLLHKAATQCSQQQPPAERGAMDQLQVPGRSQGRLCRGCPEPGGSNFELRTDVLLSQGQRFLRGNLSCQ
jgi:hypothetical protein